ncbi:MAG: F0F1 ATP synthase subunit delta [Methylophilales bacterium]|nr:F0F1 ATP synthase subunit delta [Methylophilales bacterium]
MAEKTTLARPYAVAAYRLAKQHKALNQWSDMLVLLAGIAADAEMSLVIANPKLTGAQVEQMFTKICGDKIDAAAVNLVKLLIEHDKLVLLPTIAEMYEALKAEDGGVEQAVITSATKLSKEQGKALIAPLEARFSKKIEPQFAVDPELIGGVKIVVGDAVIDASVRGQLQDLAISLKN